MDIRFLGGAGEVGRSAILIRDQKNILLDYGVKIETEVEYPNAPGRVDACIVSHAHLDHCGFLPALYYDRFPAVFGTAPTLDLAKLLIDDAMKVGRKHHDKPRYFKNQVKTLLNKYKPLRYGGEIDFAEYKITLSDAGHICGSAISTIEKPNGKRISYTGDFKMSKQFLQKGADAVQTDLLIIESTYATSDHVDRDKMTENFVKDVKETIDNGGTALVPVFAVGRSQEMLALLYKNGLIDVTYIDGMAKAATDIVLEHKDFIDNADMLQEANDKVTKVGSVREHDSAVEGGKVIVTTSGMLTGGPVLNYIRRLNRNSKIFLTGYQVEHTNGRKLLEGNPLLIDNKKFVVKHPVSFYNFSAHSGKSDLHQYVRRCNPEKVVCVHGSSENTTAFAEALKLEGFDAYAPEVGDVLKFNL